MAKTKSIEKENERFDRALFMEDEITQNLVEKAGHSVHDAALLGDVRSGLFVIRDLATLSRRFAHERACDTMSEGEEEGSVLTAHAEDSLVKAIELIAAHLGQQAFEFGEYLIEALAGTSSSWQPKRGQHEAPIQRHASRQRKRGRRSVDAIARTWHRSWLHAAIASTGAAEGRALLSRHCVYRVIYIDGEKKERRTPWFAHIAHARRALKIVRAKGFEAIIVC